MTEARYFLRGEIDLAERDRIRSELAALIEPPTDLLVDCRHLTFLDSSGVAVLVEIHRTLESHGHRMLLVNVSGSPRHVLEVLDLIDLFGIAGRGNGNSASTIGGDQLT